VSHSIQLDTTEHSVGVSVVAGSRITFAHAGVYNIQFSAQLESTAAGSNTVNIWFKKNGSNVARSNTIINVAKQAGDKVVAAWNYVDAVNANDYYEIMWQAADTTMQLLAAAATGNIPLTPSVIVTATQVM
jgi:G:T-mismatch repair DNA endonuclease (very short patch repair protein)